MGEARISPGKGPPLKQSLRAAVIALLLGAPAIAWAHAALVKSAPAQRALLYQAPKAIQLWFNERVEARYSSFALTDANGRTIQVIDIRVPADDPKSLVGTIQTLSPGKYTVKYRVLSTDGHVVQSQFNFTIRE